MQHDLPIRFHRAGGIKAITQVGHIGKNSKGVDQGGDELFGIDIPAGHEPCAEQKSVPEENDMVSSGSDPEFIRILTHVGQLAQRRCRHKQADVAGTLAVPLRADHTASVAAHRFQAVRRKHEVYATQQGRIFLLSHRKYSALGHSGDSSDQDGIRRIGRFDLREDAALPYPIGGKAAGEQNHRLLLHTDQRYTVSFQLVEHPF